MNKITNLLIGLHIIHLLCFISSSIGLNNNVTNNDVSNHTLVYHNNLQDTGHNSTKGINNSNNTQILHEDNDSIGDLFRIALCEVIELSPLAWAIILIPLITTFIFAALIIYLCCRKARKPPNPCRYDSNNLINIKGKEVKAPIGQPAPIPLTGLVNQPNGQGLKLLPKHNTHHQHYAMSSNNN